MARCGKTAKTAIKRGSLKSCTTKANQTAENRHYAVLVRAAAIDGGIFYRRLLAVTWPYSLGSDDEILGCEVRHTPERRQPSGRDFLLISGPQRRARRHR